MTAQAGEGRWLAFRTREPLPPDIGVTVAVGAGTPSAEGPLTTAAAQILGLPHVRAAARDAAPLRLAGRASARPARRGRSSSAIPSTPLRSARRWCAWSRRCPASTSPSTARCSWSRVARSRARRTASPSPRRCRTRSARPSARRRPSRSRWGRAEPSLHAAGGELVVLDPAAGPRLSVYSTGLAALKVTVHRVAPADWPAYRTFQERAARDRALPVLPGTRVVVAHGDRRRVDRRARGDRDRSPGRAARRPRPRDRGGGAGQPGRRRAQRWPGRVIQWVQATRIGLDAFVDATRLVAWATALDDGRPLVGYRGRAGRRRRPRADRIRRPGHARPGRAGHGAPRAPGERRRAAPGPRVVVGPDGLAARR